VELSVHGGDEDDIKDLERIVVCCCVPAWWEEV
jgi:hypothetical protein